MTKKINSLIYLFIILIFFFVIFFNKEIILKLQKLQFPTYVLLFNNFSWPWSSYSYPYYACLNSSLV